MFDIKQYYKKIITSTRGPTEHVVANTTTTAAAAAVAVVVTATAAGKSKTDTR